MKWDNRPFRIVLTLVLITGMGQISWSQGRMNGKLLTDIDRQVEQSMRQGNIPGLSMVIIDGGRSIIRSYGCSDGKAGTPVGPHTLFQIGSCSKAFTALAVEKLAAEGLIDLKAPLSRYLPWFQAKYKDTPVAITLMQLLHHSSGLPWQTIATIPPRQDAGALEQTVRNLNGVSLHHLPGRRYEYATANYDILALVAQEVMHEKFEHYVQKNILDPLGMSETRMGYAADSSLLAKGYKIGFFRAREYIAPVYAGNNAAGYVISSAADMDKWLRFQMGLSDTGMYDLAKATHVRDEKVPLHGMSSYAMGWQVSLSGNGEIYHDGLNPNYSAYIAFRSENKLGVAVLANSNSSYTPVIGNRVIRMLAGEHIGREYDPGDGNDAAYSILSLVSLLFNIGMAGLLIMIVMEAVKGRRRYKGLTWVGLRRTGLCALCILTFIYGLYLFPKAMAGSGWDAMLVWSPVSLPCMAVLMSTAAAIGILTFLMGELFPGQGTIRNVAPRVILLSILSGIANMVVIILVTSAFETGMRLRYILFYYGLVSALYLLGRRFVQVCLVRFSRGLVYDLRIKLIDKLFSTSYQQFESIDRGRVYTALNDDVEMLGGAADQFIMLVTNTFTVVGAFFYLLSVAFWTAALTIALILFITALYFAVSRNSRVYFEKARDIRNVFIRQVNGIVDGFKEISLHRKKKEEYRQDIAYTAGEYKVRMSIAGIRFVNALLVGDSLLIILLGGVAFGVPRLFPDIQSYLVMGFIIVLLYLIGPVNAILNAVPAVVQLRVAWRRLQGFFKDIPENMDKRSISVPAGPCIKSFKAGGIRFRYKNSKEREGFCVGPIDMEVNSGEILFIIGGNGSGKTTLAKLLVGLYQPDEGVFMIDDAAVESSALSEYFSVSFNPPYLFERLYSIDTDARSEEIASYLRMLDLDKKIIISGNRYNTIDLSGGQRKRLALLQCYLENAPIYLFDEWAADQDPDYRNFFYRTLLPEMRSRGKIIIAITHDDHYFDVADKILRMRQGELEDITQDHIAFHGAD